jgi:hypothetical protein
LEIKTKRPVTLWIAFCLACFEVISAVPYGLALSIDPTGNLVSMPVKMLMGSPFRDFRIPGLILLVVLGMGALLLAIALYRLPSWFWAARLNPCKSHHWAWTATFGYGFVLMIWIATQVILIGFDSWLQPLHFAIGLILATVAMTSPMRRYLNIPRRQEKIG